jgi:hypothetical protein
MREILGPALLARGWHPQFGIQGAHLSIESSGVGSLSRATVAIVSRNGHSVFYYCVRRRPVGCRKTDPTDSGGERAKACGLLSGSAASRCEECVVSSLELVARPRPGAVGCQELVGAREKGRRDDGNEGELAPVERWCSGADVRSKEDA